MIYKCFFWKAIKDLNFKKENNTRINFSDFIGNNTMFHSMPKNMRSSVKNKIWKNILNI